MSSLLINAASVDYKDNINNKKENFSKMTSKNRTLKNNSGTKLKAEFLKENFNINNNDSDDEDLENFNDESIIKNNPVQQKNIENRQTIYLDNNVSNENYIPYHSEYYEKYMQNLEKIQNTENNNSNNELLKKIDNILYLLEDQNEQHLNYITEELILYIFLGIFIIYVLDSFVKVGGKYTR